MAEYYSLPNGLQRIKLGEPIDFGDDVVPIEQETTFDSTGEKTIKYIKYTFERPNFPSKKEDTTMVHNFSRVIDIERNTLGDTRTAEKKPTFEEFKHANRSHMVEVERVMNMISDEIKMAGNLHDRTKMFHDGEFYRDFCKTLDNPKEKFEKSEWYQMHIEEERHHILARTPDDVDLIDILEHIVDCCCAGKARSGEISPVVIPDDILQKAVANTVKLIDNNTRIV